MSDTRPTVTIPDRHQTFCREVAKLCRAHGLGRFSGTFRPGFKDGWDGDIAFSWDQGRHGAEAGQVHITSQFHVNTKIDVTLVADERGKP